MKKALFLSLVTLLAIMAHAQNWSFAGGTMYFDNSATKWSEAKMMLVIGNDCWSEIYEMQPAGQAHLWSVTLPNQWNGPSYMAILNGKDLWNAGTWGPDNLHNASHYSAAYESGLVSVASDEYILVPQSADNGCQLALYRKGEEPAPAPEYHWFVKGDFDDWAGQPFVAQPEGAAHTVYATIQLPAAKELVFKLQGRDIWYGNSGMMTQANHTAWTFGSDNNANCALITTVAGDYIFALDTTTMSLTVNYPYNPKQSTLYDSPVRDANPDVMLQAFYWAHVGNTEQEYTEFGDVKWSALNAEAAEIAANFDLVWLAPSQETADYTGYLPINYSKQGQVSYGTQGHTPWGSAQDLRNLIDNLHKGGAKVIADIVLNHSSASHPDEYTGPNYNWCTWGTIDFGRYGQLTPTTPGYAKATRCSTARKTSMATIAVTTTTLISRKTR